MLEESPFFDDIALEETKRNQSDMAREGRDPEFRLIRDGSEVEVRAWALEILDRVLMIAAQIDSQDGGDSYVQAVRLMVGLVDDPDTTPSARLLDELRSSGSGFFDYAISMARSHRDYFASITTMSAQRHEQFGREATDSMSRQGEIEANDDITFEQYLANYYAAE